VDFERFLEKKVNFRTFATDQPIFLCKNDTNQTINCLWPLRKNRPKK